MILLVFIRAQVDGTPGTDDLPGRLILQLTDDGASTPSERVRIDSSGNLGVGETRQQNLLNLKLRMPQHFREIY